jgi:hypothetical protein
VAVIHKKGTVFSMLSEDIYVIKYGKVLSTRYVPRCYKRESNARGDNWSTLFLGEINTGTCPSELGESQLERVKIR